MEGKTCKKSWGTIGEEDPLKRFPANPTVGPQKPVPAVVPLGKEVLPLGSFIAASGQSTTGLLLLRTHAPGTGWYRRRYRWRYRKKAPNTETAVPAAVPLQQLAARELAVVPPIPAVLPPTGKTTKRANTKTATTFAWKLQIR